ncbi:MAG: sporulation protein Cse60 [Bacillota bacterium]|nr:sporulation protein Cse60 [Bacillota bacterium]
MIKTKLFGRPYRDVSEDINRFLENNSVQFIDVKYQLVSNGGGIFSCALLIYKELPPVDIEFGYEEGDE